MIITKSNYIYSMVTMYKNVSTYEKRGFFMSIKKTSRVAYQEHSF